VTSMTVEVDGRELALSSLDRVLWPRTGTTKAELLDYYLSVAPVLLPHLRDRPVTLHRYPSGVGGPHFFQTRTPPRPGWVRTVTLAYPRTGKVFDAPVLDDTAALVWALNLTTLEFHPFLGTTQALDVPTAMVLDLDPGPPAGTVHACAVALMLRTELEQLGLESYPKSSGGKGVHVYVPLAEATYTATKKLARELARALATRHPDVVVDKMAKSLRTGRVLVDWSQNDPGKSTVAAWSTRGGPTPTVSAPVRWRDVERVVANDDASPLHLGLDDARRHLEENGDLFSPVLTPRQRLRQ
jgi:bifunctional non-homologous end joining protein LigD